MPNVTPTGTFDFSDAPGGDLSLDDIFDLNAPEPTTNEPQSAPVSNEPETFLQTATGTVYKSADEAVKGIEHKDALIAELRQKLSEQTGQDPIRKVPPVEDTSYSANPKKYFEDIRNAKSEDELARIQSQFIDERLSPYAPYLAHVAKSRAIEETAADMPEISTFLHSSEYKNTLEAYPLLKQAIGVSETNPQASVDLGQLYRMAATLSAGQNVSKIVQSTARPAATETRPTVSSTPTTPPGTTRVAPPSLYTSEGRKSIMEEQKARGVEDLRF